MIDFHNHLLPGVDDGAADIGETRAALQAMQAAGVRTIVMTPHLRAGITERAADLAAALGALDAAFESVREVVAADFPGLEIARGVELMLDSPTADLSDPRVRLAGTQFVLVEFPSMIMPPHCAQALFELKQKGWKPIVAHPERYQNLEESGVIHDIRSIGCFVQINSGSLVGRYGGTAQTLAWSLLEEGAADFLSSDYHCRGQLQAAAARDALVERGAGEQARLLTEDNPARMLAGEDPHPVPPVRAGRSFWKRLLGR